MLSLLFLSQIIYFSPDDLLFSPDHHVLFQYLKVNQITNVTLEQFSFSNSVTVGEYFQQDIVSLLFILVIYKGL